MRVDAHMRCTAVGRRHFGSQPSVPAIRKMLQDGTNLAGLLMKTALLATYSPD
jgi:hypothetical protein